MNRTNLFLIALANERYEVEVEGDVLKLCGIDTSRAYFAYNSTELSDDDEKVLNEVGACLTTGPLHGRSILVTGYTDSAGAADQNLALGLARSRAVGAALITRGVCDSRVYLHSRGERRAHGDTPEHRALDRKVELRMLVRN